MKKLLFIMLIVLCVALAGCGKTDTPANLENVGEEAVDSNSTTVCDSTSAEKDSSSSADEDGGVNLEKLNAEIMEAIGAADALEFTAQSVYALYGIEESDIKQCSGFTVMEGTFPHEIVMIEAADDEAAARIEAAFESKIKAFTEQSRNYDAKNYALAQKCTVQKNGRFYAMFLSPDFEGIMEIYGKYIK